MRRELVDVCALDVSTWVDALGDRDRRQRACLMAGLSGDPGQARLVARKLRRAYD